MAEGMDNVENCLSCDNSSYVKRNLEVCDSGVHSVGDDKKYSSGGTDGLG